MRCVPSSFTRVSKNDLKAPRSPEFSAAIAGLSRALIAWRAQGLNALGSGEQDLTPLIWWSLLTIVLWWIGHAARRRFGRGALAEPGPQPGELLGAEIAETTGLEIDHVDEPDEMDP